MTEIELAEQLRRVYAEMQPAPLGAAEFTAAMFAEINGCGPSTAARILHGALKSGRITCVGHRLHLGRKNKAYRFS